MYEDRFEEAFQLLKHSEMYGRLLIRKADILKKGGMLKDIYCYPFSVEQISKMISNVAWGIEQDKEWKNNKGVEIFKINLK